MQTEKIEVSRREAQRLYHEYSKHRAYGGPMDQEITRTYYHLSKGKTVIRAIESVKAAGVDAEHMPKLALAPALAKKCEIRREHTGSLVMTYDGKFGWRDKDRLTFADGSFNFPRESFPLRQRWEGNPGTHHISSRHAAIMPIIPLHLRPRKALENYHILFEPEWHPVPPRDPLLLRRIGKADLWLVVAAWDLTEVERAVLATRISVN